MFHHLIIGVYEHLTGRPYYTGRQASVDFGPPPAAVHAHKLAQLDGDALDRRWLELKAQHARARHSGQVNPTAPGWTSHHPTHPTVTTRTPAYSQTAPQTASR
jgi:hypothetical protein